MRLVNHTFLFLFLCAALEAWAQASQPFTKAEQEKMGDSLAIAQHSCKPQTQPQLYWSVDFSTVLNNREGGTEETPDQTFFFTHFTPEVGLSLDSGKHNLLGGVTWYQPMGNELHGYKVVPNLYYHYQHDGLEMNLGVIPVSHKETILLRSDSINYVQPVIRGAEVYHLHGRNSFYSWLDWRQIQTSYRREAFSVGLKEFYRLTPSNHNALSLGTVVQYTHLAKSKKDNENQGVVDHVLLYPTLTYHSTVNPNDANSFLWCASLGLLASIDRDRHEENKWFIQMGFCGAFLAQWRWLRVEELLYAGKRQMPLYQRYGSQLYWGDQWLHNKFYSRTDLTVTVFKKDFLNLEAKLVFHASDTATAFWQQVTVRFFFDSRLWPKERGKHSGYSSYPNNSDLLSRF